MRKNVTFFFSAIQFFFWMCFATLSPFSSWYLLQRGLSSADVGLLLAAGGILAALLSPVIGSLMDDHPSLTSPRLFALFAGLTVAAALLLFLLSEAGSLIISFLYGFLIMMLYLGQSMLNILAVDSISAGSGLNFSLGRAVGSFGYAVSAWGVGQLTSFLPKEVIPVTVLISAGIALIFTVLYPVRSSHLSGPGRPAASAKKSNGSAGFFRRNPGFPLLLAALTLIFFCHCILNAFTLQIISPIGGGSTEVGLATAIAAFSELATVLLFGFYMRKVRLNALLRISAVAFTLKSLGSLLAPSVPVYYAVQILQLAGWGIMCIGIVYYVDRITPDRDRAKAQSWAGLTLTVANVIASVTGGWLLDHCGVPLTVTVGTLAGAVGSILLFLSTAHRENLTA